MEGLLPKEGGEGRLEGLDKVAYEGYLTERQMIC